MNKLAALALLIPLSAGALMSVRWIALGRQFASAQDAAAVAAACGFWAGPANSRKEGVAPC